MRHVNDHLRLNHHANHDISSARDNCVFPLLASLLYSRHYHKIDLFLKRMRRGNTFGFIIEAARQMSNEALKPSKLQRHLKTKHPGCDGKSREHFLRKREGLQAQQRVITTLTSQPSWKLAIWLLLVARKTVRQLKPKFSQHHSPVTLLTRVMTSNADLRRE